MSNRRKFIKQTLYGSIGIAGLNLIPFNIFAAKKNNYTKITILHTNDVHSHIEPFPKNDPKYPNLGGAARRASIIQKIRSEAKNVLLFDAGDIFQGTPYFNKYKGEIDFKVMSLMQYDAATLGNHDFDNGIEGLNKMLPFAKFPFINTNYNFDNSLLKDKIIPHKIFIKDGVKIGVFGLGVELAGLVEKKNYKEIVYNNPVAIANKTANYLKNKENCHLVICLSHLGYQYKTAKISDLTLAPQTTNIDLIIGGHTHTFLAKPTIIKDKDKKNTLITQVGWAGINLGRIDFFVNIQDKNYFYQASITKIK